MKWELLIEKMNLRLWSENDCDNLACSSSDYLHCQGSQRTCIFLMTCIIRVEQCFSGQHIIDIVHDGPSDLVDVRWWLQQGRLSSTPCPWRGVVVVVLGWSDSSPDVIKCVSYGLIQLIQLCWQEASDIVSYVCGHHHLFWGCRESMAPT